MWPTFKTEHPVEMLPVRDGDMRLATLAFGFTIGFGYFVLDLRYNLLAVSLRDYRLFVLVLLLDIDDVGAASSVPSSDHRKPYMHTSAYPLPAPWITGINISVYCIWVPAKLQISTRYHEINVVWDRIEKCLYLITDGILNWMFVDIIKKRLVSMGLKKYDKLVRFNQKIILFSLSMDVLIIGMMSYRNDFVYMQFHPVAYMVKLEIEMCMSRLMVKVATGTGEGPDHTTSGTNSTSRDRDQRRVTLNATQQGRSVNVHVATQVITRTDNEIDHEAHELEERDRKDLPLEDIENGFRSNTINLIPEDDLDQESTADTLRKKGWESNRGTDSPPQGWAVEPEQERRGVTFSHAPESGPGTGNQDNAEGTFVSYLGTQNVRMLHSARGRDGVDTP
ncbi:hypothetical protein FRC06_004364 [Ceratobasidium sp. 370]|nr:hypothetical protein FRC06_004364 [Ceratobasidium sp. 370]